MSSFSSRTILRCLSLGALASSVALAHVDINYPLGSWNFTEEQQETGAFCGGGTRASAFAWGTQEPFVSVSGDAGQQVTVRLSTTNSTTANTTVSGAGSFPIVLVENASFGESGNLCIPVDLSSYITGARATLYVEASGDDETVSSCAEVVLVPANSGESPVIDHGSAVINSETGSAYTTYEYFCNNGTIAARDACSCHCHDGTEHCDESCSADRISQAATECAATASSSGTTSTSEEDGCDCHCHDSEEHCSGTCSADRLAQARAECSGTPSVVDTESSNSSSAQPSATGSANQASVSQPVSSASRSVVGGAGAAAALVFGMAVLA